MMIWAYTLGSVILVSLLSLIGIVTLALKPERLKKIVLYLVSFAIGGLFGDALIHLIPESFKQLGSNLTTSLLIVSGILIFFILEKFLRWQHCHVSFSHGHHHHVTVLNLIADAVHNLMDGMIIGASFSVSVPIGIATTLAVILHEIPHELGNFGILIYGGFTVKKALVFNFLSALMAVAGGVLSLLIGSHIESFRLFLLPITAGGFLYMAGSDLVPELHEHMEINLKTSFLQFILIVAGIGLMSLLVLLE